MSYTRSTSCGDHMAILQPSSNTALHCRKGTRVVRPHMLHRLRHDLQDSKKLEKAEKQSPVSGLGILTTAHDPHVGGRPMHPNSLRC